jgi:NtrC-family two-component system sensor histidine kinase KinB
MTMEHNFSQDSLELLYEISRELVSSLDFDFVLTRVLQLSAENVNAERGVLIVLDEALNPLQALIVYQEHVKQYNDEDVQTILKGGMAGWVLNNRKAALVEDTSQDERWMHRPDDDPDRSGAKSAICVPIQVAGEKLVGILTIVHPKTGFFQKEHLDLLQAIADQAGSAIHNARLYRSLQQAQKRYQELFDDSIDPILVTDWNGRIVEVNRAGSQILEVNGEQLIERKIQDFLGANWSIVGQNFVKLKASPDTLSYEFEVQVQDKRRIVEVFVHKIDLNEGTFLQWMLRDITERKALEEMQESLQATIYHDLRSPLSNVLSSLDLIRSSIPQEENNNLGRLVDIATRSAERVQRLTGSLLDIYRLEAGQPIENRKRVKVARVTKSALQAIAVDAEAKEMTISRKISPGLKDLWVDEDMIQRVLINLLENAVKFTPANGSIELGAAARGDFIKIWVKDNGPGIPPEAKERIFEKFSHLQNGSTKKGVGLGLAFCRLAVEAHGGEIWVDSTEGEGSSFQLTLPVAKE